MGKANEVKNRRVEEVKSSYISDRRQQDADDAWSQSRERIGKYHSESEI